MPEQITASPTASSTTQKNRVFLVDDHAMFREGLHQLIERDGTMEVCGDAATSAEALAGITNTKPDVVLVDISLGGDNGLDLVKAIKQAFDDLPVLVVSMHDEALYAERSIHAGAMGYVMKHEPAKTVKNAISKVLGGHMYLSENMSSVLLNRLMRGETEKIKSPIETLSDRELDVFRLLGQGMGVRQIAEKMGVTIPTVNSFRNRIKEKLKLKSSTEVMLHAIQWVRENA